MGVRDKGGRVGRGKGDRALCDVWVVGDKGGGGQG